MGWSIGFDNNWNRDIGYGVPAWCDSPKCKKKIDRGLSYVCGGEPYGGENGCGLYFCQQHLYSHEFRNGDCEQVCKRCDTYKSNYQPKLDHPEWIAWKLTDDSWKKWRKENPDEVGRLSSQK